mmetsp:Transcript_55679/g.148576  ORF Transcript_55679/g.148576 Transcript_55679/m.148576 type:complete len:284 (-) Transcript_55679:123-974(-)
MPLAPASRVVRLPHREGRVPVRVIFDARALAVGGENALQVADPLAVAAASPVHAELLPEVGLRQEVPRHVQDLVCQVAGQHAEAVRDPAVALLVGDVVGVGHEVLAVDLGEVVEAWQVAPIQVVGPREDDPLVRILAASLGAKLAQTLLNDVAVGEQDARRAHMTVGHATQELAVGHLAQLVPPVLSDARDLVQHLAPIPVLTLVPLVDDVLHQRRLQVPLVGVVGHDREVRIPRPQEPPPHGLPHHLASPQLTDHDNEHVLVLLVALQAQAQRRRGAEEHGR